MRKFAEVQAELGLKKFLDSPLGALYFVPSLPGKPGIIVRHFDRDVPPALTGAFADLVNAAQQWIEEHPLVARYARVQLPIEVGQDFVSRQHHIYYTSTRSYEDYEDDEDPPEPPDELAEMRSSLQQALGHPASEKESIIEAVLARSLLEPTGKVYFNDDEGRFIVVEPKVTPQEIERWAKMS
jgi:hypothetical protein